MSYQDRKTDYFISLGFKWNEKTGITTQNKTRTRSYRFARETYKMKYKYDFVMH